MKTNHTHREAKRAKAVRNGFFVALIFSLLLNIMQQYNAIQSIGQDRTVLKSQFIGDNCVAWVTNFAASKCYLEGLAFGDAVTLMSIHPDNGKLVQDKMLARSHVRFKSAMKKFIFEQVMKIREQGYSFSFYPSDIYADEDTQLVFVTGTINPKIGTTDLPPEEVTWAFNYTVVGGEALISDFYEYRPKGH